MNYAKLELDASVKGWRCSQCGLLFDCIGRPIFGTESFFIQIKTNNWLENRPKIRFCPGCGAPVKEGYHDEEKT